DVAARVLFAAGEPVGRDLADRLRRRALGAGVQGPRDRRRLAVQLDRAGQDALRLQPGIDQAGHHFDDLVEELADLLLALARDRHLVLHQEARARDLVGYHGT